MTAHKLDIFDDVLTGIERHDYELLERQTDETRKSFAPPVVLRWLSAVRNAEARDILLMLVNERANLDFFAIGDHPDLQYRLMASCGLGLNPRDHQWIPMPARAKPKSAVHAFLAEHFPEANLAELDLLLGQFTRESFTDFLHECGLSPADEKTALDAYDRYTGNAPKKARTKKR